MTQYNHKLRLAFLALVIMLMFSVSPQLVRAEGGEDPIPGIDVIVEKDPSVVPIMNFSLSNEQIKQFNHLKGMDRSQYLASILVAHLAKKGLTKGGSGAVASLTKQIGKSWCGPCVHGRPHKVSIQGPKFKNGITAMISAKF